MFYFRTINKCENIEELNIKIREEFIKRYKNGNIYEGILPVILCSGLNTIYYIFAEKLLFSTLFLVIPTLVVYTLLKIYYNVKYGKILEEDYQWGNDGFDAFEMYTLDKMSNYKLAQKYYEENVRYQEDYYYLDTHRYSRKCSVLKWTLVGATCLGLLFNVGMHLIKVI